MCVCYDVSGRESMAYDWLADATLSRDVLAHKGGQKSVDCQDISSGYAPVFELVVFGVVVVCVSITVGCEFEV